MSYFYSASERGFYHPSIHDTMPKDAIEITDDQYAKLMDGQSQGATIEPDKKGRPMLVVYEPALEDVQAAHCAEIDAAADGVYRARGIGSPMHLAEFAFLHPTEHKKLASAIGGARDEGKAKVMAAKSDKAAKAASDAAVKALHALHPKA